MGAFLGVSTDRAFVCTRIFLIAPTASDRVLDSTADAAGTI